MTRKHDPPAPLSSDDRRLIERIARHYAPEPMAPSRRAAFERTLDQRIEARTPLRFAGPAAVVAVGLAAALLWLALPQPDEPASAPEELSVAAVTQETPAEAETSLLALAYYDSRFYGDSDAVEADAFLPDEYRAIASAFAIP